MEWNLPGLLTGSDRSFMPSNILALASLFFRLVSHRYGRGAMMLTSNKAIRDWPELYAGNEIFATAILDRFLHRAHVLNIRGCNFRLRDFEESKKPRRRFRQTPTLRPGGLSASSACRDLPIRG